MRVIYAAQSIKGRRKNNQDNYFVNGLVRSLDEPEAFLSGEASEGVQLYAVCDGMGGEASGEIASALAVSHFRKRSAEEIVSSWEKELEAANQELLSYAHAEQIRMGTTFAGVSIQSNCVQAVNLGDSRIYWLRNGRLTQLSQDHTEFQMMLEAGLVKEDDSRSSAARHRLTQYLGMPLDGLVLSPQISTLCPEDGDRFLLCSDGLYGAVSDQQILGAIRDRDVESACEALIQLAIRSQSKDNITAVLMELAPERKENYHYKAGPDQQKQSWIKRLLGKRLHLMRNG